MQLKCDLKCTFSATSSATSSAPFSASLYSFRSEPLGTIPGVLLGAPYFASSSLPQTHLSLLRFHSLVYQPVY